MSADWTILALWAAVIGSGVYHGVNPGMGWPLAVSAGLMGEGRRGLIAAMGPLAVGHFLAMAIVLLPFAAMSAIIIWEREIRIFAALLVIAVGIWLLFNRRHPRFMARIAPSRLVFWSFAIALAHGASLMLLPIYLGLCRPEDLHAGHRAAAALIQTNIGIAILVSIVHTLAMVISGGAVALAVYNWLGPQFISRSWFNLDIVWAASLILVGLFSLVATQITS